MRTDDLLIFLRQKLPRLVFTALYSIDPDTDDLIVATKLSTNELAVSFNFDPTRCFASHVTCGTVTFDELHTIFKVLEEGF